MFQRWFRTIQGGMHKQRDRREITHLRNWRCVVTHPLSTLTVCLALRLSSVGRGGCSIVQAEHYASVTHYIWRQCRCRSPVTTKIAIQCTASQCGMFIWPKLAKIQVSLSCLSGDTQGCIITARFRAQNRPHLLQSNQKQYTWYSIYVVAVVNN